MAGISGKPKIVCSSQEKQTLLLEYLGEATADRHKKKTCKLGNRQGLQGFSQTITWMDRLSGGNCDRAILL